MEGYLGEFEIENRYTKEEMCLIFITMYGGIDGSHHKDWVLDRVARILNDAPVTVTLAKWSNGHTEERFSVGTSEKYDMWVQEITNGVDGPNTYSYTLGIAP